MKWKQFLADLDRLRVSIRSTRNLETAVTDSDPLFVDVAALIFELRPLAPEPKQEEPKEQLPLPHTGTGKDDGKMRVVPVERGPDKVLNTGVPDVFLTDKDGHPLKDEDPGWQEGDI